MKLVGVRMGTAPLLMASWLVAPPVGAQEHSPPQEPATHEVHAAHGDELHHRNSMGFFIGGTYESEEKDTFFTLGAEYERILDPRFAVIVGIEYISEVDAWVLVAPFVYRHKSGFRLFSGPGLELKSRRSEHGQEPGGESMTMSREGEPAAQDESLFLWRFGVGYYFEVGERYSITPAVDLDYVREDGHWVWATVFAVTIGFDF